MHDAEAQERMYERERKREEEKKRKAETPTVRSEEEQKKFEAEATKEQANAEKKPEKAKAPNIRPLSDAKAIELGANFFSEAFIFGVAAGLLIWDAWRSRKKESARRDDVKERIETLEQEVDRLRLKYEPHLEPLVDKDSKTDKTSWYDPRSWWTRTDPVGATSDVVVALATAPAEALESTTKVPPKDEKKEGDRPNTEPAGNSSSSAKTSTESNTSR